MSVVARPPAAAQTFPDELMWAGRLLPAATWVALYSWRPFVFGLYSDDWAFILPRGPNNSILQQLVDVDTSRPGAVLIRWIVSGLAGQNPFAWQLFAITTMLAVALTLLALLHNIISTFGFGEHRARLAAAVATATYLAFPWMLGTAWMTGSLCNLATVCINLAFLAWFTRWSIRSRAMASVALFAAGSLIYEAYWFSFLPLAALLRFGGFQPRRHLLTLAASLSGIQFLLLAFNRTIAMLGIGVNKSFNPNWAFTILHSGYRTVVDLYSIYGAIGFVALIVLIGSFAVIVIPSFAKRKTLMGPALAIAAGILLSLGLLAIAGYPLRLTGLFGRTAIVMSWWLAIALALVAATIADIEPGRRGCAIGAWVGIAAVLVVGVVHESMDYATSWRQQQDILAGLPFAQLMTAPAGSLLIVEAPRRGDGVGTFNAPYDISSALWIRQPQLARHLAGNRAPGDMIAIPIPGAGYWRLRISPGHVEQSKCSDAYKKPYLVFDVPTAPETLVWKYPGDTLEIISDTAEMGCRQ
jgi:hypothetical protein